MATVLDTPEQIDLLRLSTLIIALKAHIRSNGQMRLTRTATPTAMRQWASEYMGGKHYARGMAGLTEAYNDLVQLKASITS